MNSVNVLLFGCLLTVGVFSAAVNTNEKLTFEIEEEWSLIPDENMRFHMKHSSEINTYDVEGRFNGTADMEFLLFTRRNPRRGQTILLNNVQSLRSSYFNANHETRCTIHGWQSNARHGVNTLTTQELLQLGDFNVITVDWSRGARTVNYVASRNRVEEVGAVVARFIDFLNIETGISLQSVYVIGHSLGGHAAGFAGKQVTRGRIHSIFALDPAGPLFSVRNPNERVDREDADYVEVIHTNGGNIYGALGLGMWEDIGDSDFYPNGGRSQPGCILDVAGICAHDRAVLFYAESIHTSRNGFWSDQCASLTEARRERCRGPRVVMGGEPSNNEVRGIYGLSTERRSPFAMGE